MSGVMVVSHVCRATLGNSRGLLILVLTTRMRNETHSNVVTQLSYNSYARLIEVCLFTLLDLFTSGFVLRIRLQLSM